MSPAPTDASRGAKADNYQRAFSLMHRMLHEGRSWSGNERKCCFLNTGGPRFATASFVSGFDYPDDARSIGLVDWDMNGAVDFWVSNRTAPMLRLMRNETPPGKRFVGVLLEGRACNRDAIGARLELHLAGEPPRKLLRTVRAGEGFLSQSTRWMTFGLGESAQIEKLVVRWPGGEAEEFRHLQPGRHYRLVQGSQPAVWRSPMRDLVLAPAEQKAPKSSDASRTVLLSRPELPPGDYLDTAGETRSLNHKGRPKLVSLWASWCQPCLAEMRDWSAAAARFEAAGIDVLLLNAEGPQQGDDFARRQVELQRSQGISLPLGVASAEFLQRIDILQRAVLDKEGATPLPCSMLVDASDRILVLYRGAAEMNQVLADVALLKLGAEQLRAAAVPFAGRWGSEPFVPSPAPVMQRFLRAERLDDAVAYARKFLASWDRAPDPGGDLVLPVVDGADDSPLSPAMRQRRERQLWQSSLAETWYTLGTVLRQQSKFDESLAAFEAALQHAPRHRAALMELAHGQLEAGRLDEAERSFRQAVEIKQDSPEGWAELGLTLYRAGRAAEAVECWETALRVRPHWPEAANNLAWIFATHHDSSLRNGARAVELALATCTANDFKDPHFLATLAAAYAEAGDFTAAAKSCRQAIEAARLARADDLVRRLQQRLSRLEARQPIRDEAPAPNQEHRVSSTR